MIESHDRESRFSTIAITSTSTAAGSSLGLHAANTIFPAHVEFIPGAIEADVSLDLSGHGISATYGPTLNLPNVQTDAPLVGEVGLNFNITDLNVALDDPDSLSGLSSLVTQYNTGIADPTISALTERLASGAGIGAIVGGFLGYKTLQKYRKFKEGDHPSFSERYKKLPLKKQLAVILCASIALAGCTKKIKDDFTGAGNQSGKITATPLPPSATKNSKYLEGASVKGAGDLPLKLAKAAVEYRKDVEESLAKSTANFDLAFREYSKQSSSNFFNNPSYTATMHISDAHCNYAMYEHALRPVVEAFKPSIVFNSGDTFTNGKTMPYEKDCFKSFRASVAKGKKDTTIINAIGNHDSKMPINIDDAPVVITPTMNSDYIFKSEVGQVVSTPDPSISKWEATPPEKSPEMGRLIAKQGEDTAKAACDVYDKTGEKPIVMVHRPQASYKTSFEGCASLILYGHTHNRQKIKKFLSKDGEAALHHIAGSMSGSHNTISIYETPKRPATFTMLYFDKSDKLRGSTTVTFDTSSRVSIKDEKLPTLPESPDDLKGYQIFLKNYILASRPK